MVLDMKSIKQTEHPTGNVFIHFGISTTPQQYIYCSDYLKSIKIIHYGIVSYQEFEPPNILNICHF